MATVAEALTLAMDHHRTGRYADAEQLYRQILEVDPNQPDAWHLLGVIAYEVQRADLAVEYIQKAIAVNPHDGVYYGNLGLALQGIGRLDDAIQCYQRALQIAPGFVHAYNNFGNVLAELKRFDDALICYQRALQLDPNFAQAYNNLGNVLTDMNRHEDALPCYRRALLLKPDYPEAHNNLGNALRDLGELEESEAQCREATRLKPDYFEAHNNLGAALHEQSRLQEALTCYEESIRLNPDYSEAHWNRALGWLVTGNFEQGWPEYEWRFKRKIFPPRPFPQPIWDGSSLAGKTILVHAEQGLGDTLQFIRYVLLVKKYGGRIIVEAPPMLMDLIASCAGVDEVVMERTELPPVERIKLLPPFDVHIPLISLPTLFKTTLATIPANVPYLAADAALREKWRRDLSPYSGFKIGLSWQGDPKHRKDRFRSIPLARFEPLARLEGVSLFSIQKGPGAEQLSALAGSFPIIDLGDKINTFGDTAAAMMNLDLVIAVDSAAAHCAGAIAVPVWLAVPSSPDFRWMLQREDSPWYPTMRLFRQQQLGVWDDVLLAMTAQVAYNSFLPADGA